MTEHHERAPTVLAVTPEARTAVLEALANESDAESLALWVEITGEAGGAYAYDLYFQARADALSGDLVQPDDELPVVIPAASVEGLDGATLDVVTGDTGEAGLAVVNPNTPPARQEGSMPAEAGVDLTDPLAQQVVLVLEEQVNPSIAVHGGRADLVAVESSSVYLRLSGGCQGCGMAKATLTQGIEVILRDAIPGIADIVDVTDHAEGTEPFYAPVPG